MQAVLVGRRGNQVNEDRHDATAVCRGVGLVVVHPSAKSLGVQAKGRHRRRPAGIA